MNIDYSKITGNEFTEVQGERILTNDTIDKVKALSYSVHGSMDVAGLPFWATKVQDTIEQTCVTYSKENVEEGKFLGARITETNEGIEISLGHVGEVESLIAISFKKEVDEEGIQVLGEAFPFGLVEHVG